MRRFVLAVASLVTAGAAFAEDTPAAGRHDPRMRYLSYNPDEVVKLSTAVGSTLVVTFGPTETVTAVAVSNSRDLSALPRGNYLFFKASQQLPAQPVIVLTSSEAGMRRYVFSISSRSMANLEKGQPDLYYSVQFGYPQDEAAARRRLAEQKANEANGRAAAGYQRRAQEMLNYPMANNEPPSTNWNYVGQGDHSLLPIEVFDDGHTTRFRFPGNMRIPSIYRVNPDGREATANYTVKGDYVEVPSVAKGWKLRDGRTLLCVWNTNFDPVGRNPGTGTVRADIERVVKGSSH
ncbi:MULTISPECIES: P-type conjugative transfer protein VirB9 [unclassified Rhizobium]|uniref:P-type conjugative transfer protein VirB9 n=1 Tax=unclassified Rhizobium TaxID=2613769 RepID=UPI001783D8FA|nr:P-type conjugative transfer protein VirB9 [Rhizobium sp. CFBP 13644]MBD8694443.1 P-type conjugative transfer protein VirB9 [Rhizobium sp. CFBP 13717]